MMTISGDDIVEASLLRPTKEDPGPSPMPEEEAALLGEGSKEPETPGSAPEHSEVPKHEGPAKQITTLPSHSSPQPHCHPNKKARKYWEVVNVDPNNPGWWVQTYLQKETGF